MRTVPRIPSSRLRPGSRFPITVRPTETDIAVAGLTSMLEPIMMVGIGGMVGVVLVSMYLPIFSLAGNIKAD